MHMFTYLFAAGLAFTFKRRLMIIQKRYEEQFLEYGQRATACFVAMQVGTGTGEERSQTTPHISPLVPPLVLEYSTHAVHTPVQRILNHPARALHVPNRLYRSS